MAKQTVQTFVVRSLRGYSFPIDMLRYDGCIPDSEIDSVNIGCTFDPSYDSKGMTIALRTYHSTVSKGRWESFGWTVD